jgi:hypothetical protein
MGNAREPASKTEAICSILSPEAIRNQEGGPYVK